MDAYNKDHAGQWNSFIKDIGDPLICVFSIQFKYGSGKGIHMSKNGTERVWNCLVNKSDKGWTVDHFMCTGE